MDWRDVLNIVSAVVTILIAAMLIQGYTISRAKFLLFLAIGITIEMLVAIARTLEHMITGTTITHTYQTAFLVPGRVCILIGSLLLVFYIRKVYHRPKWPWQKP